VRTLETIEAAFAAAPRPRGEHVAAEAELAPGWRR
jgi:hypothetical protein